MADKKISELTALTSPDGAEELVVNDGGTSKKITITNAVGDATQTELGYLSGVTSAIQTQLDAKASEGTEVKSTGETGGTKFLREDGDGTCSWQTVPAGGVDGIVSSADATAITIDANEYVGIGASPSGDAILDVETATGGKWACQVTTTHSSDGMGLMVDSPNQNNTLPIFLAKSNGTERLKLTADGRGLSQFTAKAWALWNGTGTPDFRDSHNCSSISDEATGTYKVHFTNNMGSSDYSASFCCQVQSTYTNVADNAQFDTSTSSYFYCAHKENGSVDPTYASMIIFGD